MESNGTASAGTVQCPYTLSTCPLFNPSASVLEAGKSPRPPCAPAGAAPGPDVDEPGTSSTTNVHPVPGPSSRVNEDPRTVHDEMALFYSNYSLAPTPGRNDPTSEYVPLPPLPTFKHSSPPVRYHPYELATTQDTRSTSRLTNAGAGRRTASGVSRGSSPEAGPSRVTSAEESRVGSPRSPQDNTSLGDGDSGSSAVGSGSAEAITPFISKLAHLLSRPQDFSSVIWWSVDGSAFLFTPSSPELQAVFARYFRHSNVHSFIRQLSECFAQCSPDEEIARSLHTMFNALADIYGFRRLSTFELLSSIPAGASSMDLSGFSHPLMWRDGAGVKPCDLSRLKPKGAHKARSSATPKTRVRKSSEGSGEGGPAGGARRKASKHD